MVGSIRIATFVGIFIPHLGMYVANKFKHTKTFLACSYIGLAVLYGISHLSLNLFYVAIITMLYRILNDFYVPVEEKLYNKHTPSSHRASVNSVKSMIEATGVLVGMVGAGFLVDMYGGAITISLAAIVVIPAVVILFGINEKKVRKA